MRTNRIRFAVLFGILSLGAEGAEVLQFAKDYSYVLVTVEEGSSFNVGDRLCVLDGEQEIACGSIMERKSRHALAQLQFHNLEFKIGSPVRSLAASPILPVGSPEVPPAPQAAPPTPREADLSVVSEVNVGASKEVSPEEPPPSSAPVLSNGRPDQSHSANWSRIELIQFHRELIRQQDEYSDNDEIQFNLTD